jgi:hypothetical protein
MRFPTSRTLVSMTVTLFLTVGLNACGSGPDDPYTPTPDPTETYVTPTPDPAETYVTPTPDPTETYVTPTPDPTESSDGPDVTRTSVPSRLVGQWDGDDADYTFTPDGDVSIAGIGQGTVVVDGSQIAFYVSGQSPWSTTWRVDPCGDPAGYGYPYRTLFLGGYSYVQDCQ